MTASSCPYCRTSIDPSTSDGLLCEGCSTPHHKDCYAENGGCTLFGCRFAPAEEPKVAVSSPELAAVAASRAAPAVTAPTFAGYAPVPAPVTSASADGNSNGAVVIDSAITYVPPPVAKNKMTFILLGVFLGALGAHNFYAGYTGKAIAQLCLSVLTLGYGSPMAWLWAVIEICIVNQDSRGVQFQS